MTKLPAGSAPPNPQGRETLVPERTALLLFDFLNGHFKGKDAATTARLAPVIANAARLLAAARASGALVAYACAAHRADGGTSARTMTDTDNRLRPWGESGPREPVPIVAAGTVAAEIIDELAPTAADYVVPKYRWSSFHGTYLDLALRTRGIDVIVLAGGSTDVGVASTAFAARDLDYNLVVASDACTSGETDNHDQLMRRVFPRMSRVRTTDEIVGMLR